MAINEKQSYTQYTTAALTSVDDGLRADLAASSGSSLVGFLQGGAGAQSMTVQAKLRGDISPRDFGAKFDGATDDSAAWQAALDYVGSLGGGTVVFDGFASKITSATRLRVPRRVTILGNGTFEGANGTTTTSMATLWFSDLAGGLTLEPNAALQGFNVNAPDCDTTVLVQGNFGIRNMRMNVGKYGIRADSTLDPAFSLIRVINPGSGLTDSPTNQPYSNVSFTSNSGGGITPAKLTVTVSGGIVTKIACTQAGTGYAPSFMFSIPADALYPGSPALPLVGDAATAQMGRSRIQNLFMIAKPGFIQGIEIDGSNDFFDLINFHVWGNEKGVIANSVALRMGRVDGYNITNMKVFGINTAIVFSDIPDAIYQPFGMITACNFDLVNIGINILGAQRHMSIQGNIIRSIGHAIWIASQYAAVDITGNCFGTNAATTIQVDDCEQVNINGNTFQANSLYDDYKFRYISIGGALGQGRYYVGGNSTDGKHPFVQIRNSAKGGTIAANDWATPLYADTTVGYCFIPAGDHTMLPSVGGRLTVTMSTSDILIPHGLRCNPQLPTVTVVGSAAPNRRAILVGSSDTYLTVRILDNAGTPVTTGTASVMWTA